MALTTRVHLVEKEDDADDEEGEEDDIVLFASEDDEEEARLEIAVVKTHKMNMRRVVNSC